MKEDFLHYLWKFKKFNTSDLLTTNNQSISIQQSGQYLQLAGPDFFNAQINIDNQKWAGNVEIHLKSSDWYLHHHESDAAYDNVILHIVWQHDMVIYRKDNTEIPTLVLKDYVATETMAQYQELLFPKTWIYCERQIATVDAFILRNWQERLFFERLERKSNPIALMLEQTQNDWETVLFCMLAKNFGLNTNGETFFKVAQSIPFSILRKMSHEVESIEALLLGKAGLLNEDKEDVYFKNLKSIFQYLLIKYQLTTHEFEPVQFFKHRPDNFPTIRLSQLANLYSGQSNLFSKIIQADSIEKLYALFQISASTYWQTHYQFDATSPKKSKSLSKAFIHLIIINTIIPIQFAYAKSQGQDSTENGIRLLENIAAEQNGIIQKFHDFGIMASNAFESQSLLQLKNEYCNKSQCLNCAIGIELLKSN
ncbi:DUF2851 family protein [Flavobacterium sp.]|uniref:DUF2851 family protein n=1 Tax=Flavobacterium sp. TaxID=239 RepID=UPI00286D478E|nr:DUF2851 family protein [Flavobacterium sp.]